MSFSSCSSLKMQSHPHQNVVDIATSNISDIINGCQLSNFNKIFALIPKRFRFDVICVHKQVCTYIKNVPLLFINQITIAKVSLLLYNYATKGQFQNNCDIFSELRVRLKNASQNHLSKTTTCYELHTNFDVNLSKKVIDFQHTPARYTYVNQFKFYF